MRAYVVYGPGKHELCEIDEPTPDYGEVLIAPAAVGICGSDRELLEGRRPEPYVCYPVVPGHEWAGYVVSCGPGVSGLSAGCAVVAEGIRGCGTCPRCCEGRSNLCTSWYAETGFTHQGALADRLAVPANLVHPLPANRPVCPAAMLEPAACVASGLLDVGVPSPGSRVVVVGDGPVGLVALSLLRLASPRELLLLGATPQRIAFGRRMGASAEILSQDLSAADLDELRGSFDFVVDCTDTAGGAAMALQLARRAGTVLMVGIAGAGTLGIDADVLSLGNLRVQGVFGATRRAWYWLLSLYESGMFDPSPLITHRFDLDHASDAFSTLADADAGAVKVLIEPGLPEQS